MSPREVTMNSKLWNRSQVMYEVHLESWLHYHWIEVERWGGEEYEKVPL